MLFVEMRIDNMDIVKDMEDFAEDVSLDGSFNYDSSATNMRDDLFAGENQDDADYLSDGVLGNLFIEIPGACLWNLENALCTVSIPNGKQSSNESLFDSDSDEDEDIDLDGWRYKRKEEWNKIDTIHWLISVGTKIGHSFGRMSPDLALPGKELLRLSKQAFVIYDNDFGEKLFDLLHEGHKSIDLPKEPEPDHGCVIKRPPGRPRNLDTKQREPRKKLWEFIRDALLDPKYCPRYICWDNYEEKVFRIADTAKMAALWGERNNKENSNMNYEKFSRAMRYYYKKDIFESVPTRRLVYKFGKLATGLETDCPNFDPNYYSNKVKSEV